MPWYEMASNMIAHFGRHYLPDNGVMYDLGASTGNITKSLEAEIKSRNVTAISVDYSKEMAELWSGIGELIISDVRDLELMEYDFCVCFLSVWISSLGTIILFDHLNHLNAILKADLIAHLRCIRPYVDNISPVMQRIYGCRIAVVQHEF